jgi:HSP20 family protein
MEKDIDKMFDEFWTGKVRGGRELPAPERAKVPLEREKGFTAVATADLIDKKDALVIRAEIPGVAKDNIKVKVTEDRVDVSARLERKKEEKEENYYCYERTYGAWQRSFSLPERVKSERAKAKYKDGVLEITLPKIVEEKEKKKELKIE